ncbi:hypothetical protein OH77DRAFT_1362021, partial [Trametes cingulata]
APGAPLPLDPSNPWECPYCGYAPPGRRKPDLDRHVRTHTASPDDWVCCGVPLRLAPEYGVRLEGEAEVLEYAGERMVGWCFKGFSRKDALTRHLRNARGCVGDVNAAWLPGNQ